MADDAAGLVAAGRSPDPRGPRTAFAPLRHRNFRLLWTGMLVSQTGSWMQTMADVLGVPLQVSAVEEPALVGSAVLGYTALGVYSDVVQATQAMVQPGARYTPHEERVEEMARRYRFFLRLMTDLAGAFTEHARS